MRFMFACLALVFLSGAESAKPNVVDLQEKQRELGILLKQIIIEQLGVSGVEVSQVDSETSYILQVYYPREQTQKLSGQAGEVLRSLKILFNEMYLASQSRLAAQQKTSFTVEKAKRLYLKFIANG